VYVSIYIHTCLTKGRFHEKDAEFFMFFKLTCIYLQ